MTTAVASKPKLIISLDEFRSSFAQVAGAASKKNVRPILQNVLVDGDLLKATDGETFVCVKARGLNGDVPPFLVPAQWFGQVLARLTGDTCTLTFADGKVLLKSDRSKVEFPTTPVTDFPSNFQSSAKSGIVVDAGALRTALSHVSYALDEGGVRYALGGVLLEIEHHMLLTIATDGNRLSADEVSFEGTTELPGMTVVPNSAIQKIVKMIAGAKTATISATANHVLVGTDNATLSSLLIEGRFPQWRNVMPTIDDCLQLPAGVLLSVVEQVALANDASSLRIDFAITSGSLTLSAESETNGKATSEIPVAANYDSTFKLDNEYVREFLRQHEPEAMVAIGYQDGPVLFTCGTNRCVIMPMLKD